MRVDDAEHANSTSSDVRNKLRQQNWELIDTSCLEKIELTRSSVGEQRYGESQDLGGSPNRSPFESRHDQSIELVLSP
jgi:hypothetical protein